ncbi:MAG TPA: hypothetical protein VFJ47_15255 [Terriglobales bacterium]|nr:hypothetical protein [Terriglobales bacterium]
MAKSKTHFDQIPISAVKKIAEIAEKEAVGKHDIKNEDPIFEHPRRKMEPYSVRTNSQAGD